MANPPALPSFFSEVQVKFSSLYTAVLERYDLSLPQYSLLNVLDRTNGMTMTEMSRRLHISKPAVTNLVDRLEKAGLLKRLPDAKDRRVYLLEIQKKGRKMVCEIRKIILEKTLYRSFENFKTSEQKTIQCFFEVLSSQLDKAID